MIKFDEIKAFTLLIIAALYNITKPQHEEFEKTNSKGLQEIYRYAGKRSDINEHLPRIFTEAVETKPEIMVELGTRGGASTFALEKAALETKAKLISVDMEPLNSQEKFKNWIFIQADDIVFGNRFQKWAGDNNLKTTIDFLFIDTSHEYEHTKKEIETWFPLLSPSAKVVFHDTNMRTFYKRADGSIGAGWNNKRAVIRAIEEFLNTSFDEKKDFEMKSGDWFVKHRSTCNGFTVLERKIE